VFVTSSIVIPAGETTAEIVITPINDSELELPETVILSIDAGDYDILGLEAGIVITDFNVAPEWSSASLIWPVAEEDMPYSAPSLATEAADPNGDDLSFEKLTGPAWLQVAVDGSVSGTPDGNDAGLNEFTVRVTDPGGLFADADLEIGVDFINLPPAFSSATLTPGNAVALIPYSGQSLADFASDPNLLQGDVLTYTKLSGPSWLEVAADGALAGTAANEDIGFAFINVRVTDSAGLFANATVQLIVSPAVFYLDTNGASAGSGTPAAVTWDTSAIWSTSAAGDGDTYGWADGALAVFSAGDDAIASAVTVDGARVVTGFIVEEGEPALTGGTLVLGDALTEFSITGNAMIASTIAGGANGLVKTGDGGLELSGNNTFTGGVNVSSGSLVLNGSLDGISELTVQPGATLSGGGTIGSAVAVSGTLSPGDGVGTLTTGVLTFINGALLEWQAGDWSGEPDSGHDLVVAASLDLTDVTGLTIAPSDLDLTNFSEVAATFVLISCAGPITGFDEENITIDATEFTSGTGTWSVRVDGNELFIDYAPPPPFEAWLLANFGPEPRDPLVAGEMADPDHDSVSNLMEYALGTDPNLSGPAGYVWDLMTVEDMDYLRLTIIRNPAATDVIYTVQTTGDLADPDSWTELDTEIITDTAAELVVRDALAGAKRFIRLRVSR
jgi:autotransporter-associated beta strand protein